MKTNLILIAMSALLMTACASQQTLDAHSAEASKLRSDMRQAQSSLVEAQQRLEAQIAALESAQGQISQKAENALTQAASANTASARALETSERAMNLAQESRKEVSDLQSSMAALSMQVAAANSTSESARATAEDAIKIARDSRSVAGKVVESVTLNEDMISYNYEQPDLTTDGKKALDDLITKTKPLMPHAFIEIVGFTDNASLGSQNRRVALERAESVRRYLRETGGFPLHRMATISYGDLQPVAGNNTYESRSQNRRVIVQILK